MNISEKRISQLITQYIKGILNAVDKMELDKWLEQPENKKIFDKIIDKQNIINKSICYESYDVDLAWKHHRSQFPNQAINRRRWISYAAAILLPLTVIGSIFLMKQVDVKQEITEHQILPGKSSAMIYFSDGDIVNFDNDTMNSFVKQNIEIKKLDGKLIINSRISEAKIV
jgi:hypothetical protein